MEHGARAAGDIAQLRDERFQTRRVLGPDRADTTHRTPQEFTALELNDRAPAQPRSIHLHEQTTIRAPAGDGDALAQQQVRIKVQG